MSSNVFKDTEGNPLVRSSKYKLTWRGIKPGLIFTEEQVYYGVPDFNSRLRTFYNEGKKDEYALYLEPEKFISAELVPRDPNSLPPKPSRPNTSSQGGKRRKTQKRRKIRRSRKV
jgi:hypothetical protein